MSPGVQRDLTQTQFETERLSFEGTETLKDKDWEKQDLAQFERVASLKWPEDD